MNWHYAYTPYLWPMLAAAVFLAALAAYGWRRRSVPGALPFAVMMFLLSLHSLSAVLGLAALELPAKIFWVKFQHLWSLPMVSAGVWFALEYANLSRWLNRRTLALLAGPPLLLALLILTNDAHRLVVRSFSVEERLHSVLGPAGWIAEGYAGLLAVIMSAVFVWLFVRSPEHRRPVALCLIGQLVIRVAYVLDAANANPAAPMDLIVLGSAFTATTYSLALFGFRMLDLVSIARGTMVDQMREGMLVLDSRRRIVYLNPAAQRILGITAARALGCALTDVFPVFRTAESELTLRAGGAPSGPARDYALSRSALKDRRGLPLGTLVLLHDVTEQKQAQAQLIEQQRALATLRERDRVAREMHDSLGQVLGYVKMQAQSARALVARNQDSEADACLAQLSAVAQDAHADVREYILGVRAAGGESLGFLPTLETYLQRFTQHCGIAARLKVAPELADHAFEPMVEAQLLRIIQEALSNVRKHARARGVDIRLEASDGRAEAIVQDDGGGFDPALLETAEGQKFGLRFMRERAQEVGGCVRVHSVLGEGTQVVISVPLRKGRS